MVAMAVFGGRGTLGHMSGGQMLFILKTTSLHVKQRTLSMQFPYSCHVSVNRPKSLPVQPTNVAVAII